MSIVVTTPTGKIGSQVAQRLLDGGHEVTVIARDPSKVADLVACGAGVVTGSHADAAVLTRALEGAEALFLLTPPDFATADIRASYRRFGQAAIEAIAASDVGHVVHLSSVGADLPAGNGPIAGLYVNEQLLAGVDAHVVHLRPGYFMENTMGQIGAILQAGSLFTTFDGGTRFAMVATRDIAARAAELLAVRDWTGQRVVELQGAEETSYGEVAAVLGEVLGQPLQHVTVTAEQQREALMGMGASAVLADSFHEMAQAVEQGLIRFHEPRSAANTTPTTYGEFAREVFAPALEAAAKAA